MASRKIYYTDAPDESSDRELEIHMNKEGKLWVCLSDKGLSLDPSWIVLPREDAIEIITSLARDYDLIDESEKINGRYFWNGELE